MTTIKLIKFLLIFNFVTMYRFLIAVSFLLINFLTDLKGQQSLKGRFGFGLGYSSGIELSSFEVLNRNFLKLNEKGLTDNLKLGGFSGYFYFLILPDTRVSLNFFQGEKETQPSQGRFLKYEQDLWNFGFEYTFSISHLNVSPGLMFGVVTDYVELINYDGSQNFSNLIGSFNQSNYSSILINFENKAYHISPGVSLEYSLSRFVAARINYSYLIRLNEDWKFLRRFSLSNFPSEILKNSHLINFGILIGFMSK